MIIDYNMHEITNIDDVYIKSFAKNVLCTEPTYAYLFLNIKIDILNFQNNSRIKGKAGLY